jgi:hypothetical protein
MLLKKSSNRAEIPPGKKKILQHWRAFSLKEMVFVTEYSFKKFEAQKSSHRNSPGG